MGEAILVKAGGLGSGVSDPDDQNIISWELKTELITNSQQFIVPKAKDQQFSVRIFGGGGGGSNQLYWMIFPGGSGNMNFAQLKLNKSDIVPVIIGAAGRNNEAGGTTSFGTYLSATGGGIADVPNHIGGPGGVGSEGTLFIINLNKNQYYYTDAGISTYGGGGGGIWSYGYYKSIGVKGSNGGIYGGGGGTYPGDPVKTGGNGCGNGGNGVINAENGTNTIGKLLEFEGYGEVNAWQNYFNISGGGGYGGNGGTGRVSNYGSGYYKDVNINTYTAGGGGGYGTDSTITGSNVENAYFLGVGSLYYGGKGGGYGDSNGGYGNSSYGRGYQQPRYNDKSITYQYSDAKSGIAIISYYSPVYKT